MLFSLARAQEPVSDAGAQDSTLAYQRVIDDLTNGETVVTHAPGGFSGDNLMSRQVAASLLNLFDNMMVITLPKAETSIMVAGNPLPFDRNSLTEVLHANGETQFIIFETPIVSAIAGDAQPVTPE